MARNQENSFVAALAGHPSSSPGYIILSQRIATFGPLDGLPTVVSREPLVVAVSDVALSSLSLVLGGNAIPAGEVLQFTVSTVSADAVLGRSEPVVLDVSIDTGAKQTTTQVYVDVRGVRDTGARFNPH